MNRTILIGDVHGCIAEATRLLERLGAGASDRVIFVGDLVAKGPDSQAVVQLARELGAEAVVGNHEEHLLRARRKPDPERPLKPGHRKVFDALTEADWAYLEALPVTIALETFDVLVVHAGLVPGVPLEQQRRDELLNLRSITTDGRPSKRVDDGVPWASLWTGPQHVVFGHDAIRKLQRHPFATGLDTGCVYGGELTALVLPERELVSVPAKRVWSEPGR